MSTVGADNGVAAFTTITDSFYLEILPTSSARNVFIRGWEGSPGLGCSLTWKRW